jgi:hypothetical protein
MTEICVPEKIGSFLLPSFTDYINIFSASRKYIDYNKTTIIIIIIISTKISRNKPGRQRNHTVESTSSN